MSLSGAEVAMLCAGTDEEPKCAALSDSSVKMTFLLMEFEIREDELWQSGCKSRSRAAATSDGMLYSGLRYLIPLPHDLF